jgi:hypothetical protein
MEGVMGDEPNLPNLVLDEEEQALRDSDPEACFRHAIQRGALSLDQVTASLSPRIAAALHSIAAGERSPATGLSIARTLDPQETQPGKRQLLEQGSELASARQMLAGHPQLTWMLDEQILGPGQALQAARALDHLLGRYMTGTRYAAP